MDDLADLRAENEILRERIRHLETLLAPETAVIPLEWGLVTAERRIFAALTRRDVVTKEALHAALYGDRFTGDPPPLSMVESHVSKLRRKLQPFGIVVTSRRFAGYSLENRRSHAGAAR